MVLPVTLLLVALMPLISAQGCPPFIREPCYCYPSRDFPPKPASVVCENANTLQVALFMEFLTDSVEFDTLTIKDTPIRRLAPFSFGGKVKVRKLVLNRNGLGEIHPLFFVNSMNLETIEELDLSDNKIRRIPRAISSMKKLRKVSLARNKLKSIPEGIFVDLQNIESIDLSQNRIRYANFGGFRRLPTLKLLDISRNQLQTFGQGVLDQSGFGQYVADQRQFMTCGNPWHCDHRLDWLRTFLRENKNMRTDSQGCISYCMAPMEVKGLPLRSNLDSADISFELPNFEMGSENKDNKTPFPTGPPLLSTEYPEFSTEVSQSPKTEAPPVYPATQSPSAFQTSGYETTQSPLGYRTNAAPYFGNSQSLYRTELPPTIHITQSPIGYRTEAPPMFETSQSAFEYGTERPFFPTTESPLIYQTQAPPTFQTSQSPFNYQAVTNDYQVFQPATNYPTYEEFYTTEYPDYQAVTERPQMSFGQSQLGNLQIDQSTKSPIDLDQSASLGNRIDQSRLLANQISQSTTKEPPYNHYETVVDEKGKSGTDQFYKIVSVTGRPFLPHTQKPFMPRQTTPWVNNIIHRVVENDKSNHNFNSKDLREEFSKTLQDHLINNNPQSVSDKIQNPIIRLLLSVIHALPAQQK